MMIINKVNVNAMTLRLVFVFFVGCLEMCSSLTWGADLHGSDEFTQAAVNVSYIDSWTGEVFRSEFGEIARYGNGKIGEAGGYLLVPNRTHLHGCDFPWGIPHLPQPDTTWIAFVQRGGCNFDEKIANAARMNASGIIVYNNRDDGLQKMHISTNLKEKLVAVFVTREKARDWVVALENGTNLWVHISVGTHFSYREFRNINRTSILFVSISFIVLMVISLAWLVFYYVQRFRYIHAKDALARRLYGAAKKALASIPLRHLKAADKVAAPFQVLSTLQKSKERENAVQSALSLTKSMILFVFSHAS
ncbi:unnamed protein product [Darwinula stevensoni]|uniref:PA domain-containing protein n=1 Tax=Darwinula stevensoni TaxID=69355 RepID=A0A7R8X7R7_9CRUS|nr:unnamed protein product [Darwinula stevensoni]CAG0887182.1 unnamed protein product [Darwinula stevensoni]